MATGPGISLPGVSTGTTSGGLSIAQLLANTGPGTKGPPWFQKIQPAIVWGSVALLGTVALLAIVSGSTPSGTIDKGLRVVPNS